VKLRYLALSKQGLTTLPKFGEGKSGTAKAIEHLGYVQIDTLSVVERAHHHVLWCRVPGYDPTHLNHLINDKQIFEHWFHAASYLPMRDYRFVLPNMNAVRSGENRYYNNIDRHLMDEILARVRAEGSLTVRELDKGNKGKGSWWNWGPGKRAVERLFMQGDLMVSSRKGMEKVYDLAERCLPDNIDVSVPTLHEYAEYLFDTTLRAHGVFTWKQLLHLKTGKPMRESMQKILNERIDAGVVTVINEADSPSLYADTKVLEQTSGFDNIVKVLSPFDNVLIHRERLNTLFNFDYRIECYVPLAKREYGYFCLPILYNNKFVGRIDCKAHRAEQRLEVLSLHIEDASLEREQFLPALSKSLHEFANFNKCPLLDLSTIDRPDIGLS
jgi:hypothetical protein